MRGQTLDICWHSSEGRVLSAATMRGDLARLLYTAFVVRIGDLVCKTDTWYAE